MAGSDRLQPILDAVADFQPATPDGPFALPARKLVLARGYYASDEFETAEVRPGLDDAWEEGGEQLRERELLYLSHLGGGPGASSETIISSHDLPDGSAIYTEQSDYPEEGLFLLAASQTAGKGVDALFLRELLESNGEHLGVTMFVLAGEIRSLLPREELIPLFVRALECHAASGGFDWDDVPGAILGYDEDWWDEQDRRQLAELDALPDPERHARLVAWYLAGALQEPPRRGRRSQ